MPRIGDPFLVMIWLTEPIIRRAASFRSGCLSISGLTVNFAEPRIYRDNVLLMNCKIPRKEDFCRFVANVIKKRFAATSGVRYSSNTSHVRQFLLQTYQFFCEHILRDPLPKDPNLRL